MAAIRYSFSCILPDIDIHRQKTLKFTKSSFVSVPINNGLYESYMQCERYIGTGGRVVCAANKAGGFFGRLGRVIKEKAKSDVDKLLSGFSKTRDNLAVVDELLTYWNLADTEQVLDELEEVLFFPHPLYNAFPSNTNEIIYLAGLL